MKEKKQCANCKYLDNDDVIFTVHADVLYGCTKHYKRYTKLNWHLFCWEKK